VCTSCRPTGISQILHSDPRLVAEAAGLNPASVSYTSTKGSTGKSKATALESLDKQWRQIRSTIKTILDNPDSKKIYFFLCLNLAFMFVQMMCVGAVVPLLGEPRAAVLTSPRDVSVCDAGTASGQTAWA
jgi:hypothetical protein